MVEPSSLIAYRLRTVRVGVQATFFVLVPLVAFLFIPSSVPVNEPAYITSLIVAAVGGVAISVLPWMRLFEKGWGLRVMYVWSVLDILIITAILASAGRNGAPFFVLYALTTVFAAASYRPAALTALVSFTLGAYLAMVLVFEDGVPIASTVVRFSALAGVAFITGFLSRELMTQNERLEREAIERRAAEERLKASEAQLADAQRVAHLGSWKWNVQTNELTWSEELLNIFGVDKDDFGAEYDSYISAVHPEDRSWVNERVQNSNDTLEPFTFEHRIVRPDGTERILLTRGRVEPDEDGKPSLMLGTALDLTDRKKAEEAERALAALAVRQHQAMEINDNVVQGLTVAAYSLEAGDTGRAEKAVKATVLAARKIVEKLLSGRFDRMGPGDFVRSEPASLGIENESTQT